MDGLAAQLEGKLGSLEIIALFDRPSGTATGTFRRTGSTYVMGRGIRPRTLATNVLENHFVVG